MARDCEIYIASLQDVLKLLPRDADGAKGKDINLRPTSLISKAREVLRKTQKPMHVTELLAALGKSNTAKARLALSGSLSAYVRRDEIFTRPEPNTFGLKEFEVPGPEEINVVIEQIGKQEENTASRTATATIK